jgi:hypothetical protein
MNKTIKIFILLALAAVIIVILFDFISTSPSRMPANQFEYNIDEFKQGTDTLVAFQEFRQISITEKDPKAIAYRNGEIYLIANNTLLIVTSKGEEINRIQLKNSANCIAIDNEGNIVLGFDNKLIKIDRNGNEIYTSKEFDNDNLFTAIAISEQNIFAADAGTKQVVVFDKQLETLSVFKGESGVSDFHGFILPSAHFYLAVNDEDELWITNPGMHFIQNYTSSGRMRGQWGKPSFQVDGFSGCCNPSYIAFLSNGYFVTSEKGMVRIKVHKPSGELVSLVASTESFKNSIKAPAIAVDNNDNVIALDFERNLIRIFKQL